MAQIPQLQSTNTLGTDDQAILRQGTIDKRISLELAGTLSWAKRNGFTHVGSHVQGLNFTSKEDFSTFQGKVYSVKGSVSLPYTSTATDPSTDANLYLKDENNLKSEIYKPNHLRNHNFTIASPDVVIDATPQDFTAGEPIRDGWIANEACTGVTYINGELSLVTGSYYQDIPRTGTSLEYLSEFTASVVTVADKEPTVTGVSWTIVGDSFRVVVTAKTVFSVCFNEGDFAASHAVQDGLISDAVRVSQQVLNDVVIQYDIEVGSTLVEGTESITFNGNPTIYPFTTPDSYGAVSSIDIPNKTMVINGNTVRLLKQKYFEDTEKSDIRLFFVKRGDILSEDFYSDIIKHVSSTTEELYSPIAYQVTGGATQDIPSGFTFSGRGKITFDNFAFTTPLVKGSTTTISTIVGTYNGGYWIDVVDGSIFSDDEYVLFENNKPKWNLNPQPLVTVDYKTLTLPEALESYLTETRQIDRVDGNRVFFKQPFTERYDPATTVLTSVEVREDITFDGVDFEFINLQYPNMYLTGTQKLQCLNRCRFNMGMLFENSNDCYFENVQIDSEDASLTFHSSRRNSIISPKLSHKLGDASVIFYQGSMDNELIGGSASMKDGSFASAVLIYDISNRCTVTGFNAKGFHRGVDVRGYSRGVVANDNTLTINYLRTSSRNFSICVNAEFTSELTAKGNRCVSAVIPDAAYNMIGLYCVGVSDSSIENNDFTNCSIFCHPPAKFLGYTNFVEEGNANSSVSNNNLKSRMTIPNSFKQNSLDYTAVIAPALVTDVNIAPAFLSRYAIINNSPLTGWRMYNNSISGFPCAKVDINANIDSFSSILRGGSIDNCGCGVMVLGSGAPTNETIPVHIVNHDFEDTYNAVVNFYYPGMVVDFNNFTNCHNLINYAEGTTPNPTFRGHAFSGTVFGEGNSYKHYYNLFANSGTFNILNDNVTKLPDGVEMRFNNDYVGPIDRTYKLTGNNALNEALPVTKIRRNVTEIQE